jgi:hypothetical protein
MRCHVQGFVTLVPPVIDAAYARGPDGVEDSIGHRKQASKRIPRRDKNFTLKEDELLCAAYLNVSKDCIVGYNQASGGY